MKKSYLIAVFSQKRFWCQALSWDIFLAAIEIFVSVRVSAMNYQVANSLSRDTIQFIENVNDIRYSLFHKNNLSKIGDW